MKKIILLYLSIVFITGCNNTQPKTNAANKNEPRFSVEQLQEDFKVFRTSLQEIHPGLYSFVSKDSMDYYFNNTFATLNHPMTKDEFFRLLTPIIRMTYDEHTSLDFSYKYDSLKKFLPVKIRWVNNIPYIYKNLLKNPTVILGSEIISIDGRNSKEIFKEIKSVYRNGTTDETLEYDVYSLHFDYLYASFIEQPDSFSIDAINPVTKEKYIIRSPALLITDTIHCIRIPQMAEDYCKKDTCYRFNIDKENGFAKMTISGLNTYEMEASKIDFHKQLDDDFKRISAEKISNLIIDLRYCFGGSPRYGAKLVSHLYNKSFRIFDTISSAITKVPTYSKYTNWSQDDWIKEVPLLKELKSNSITKNDWSTLRDTLILPNKQQFRGNIYVLINSDIHSAASITSALLDHHTNATFIGTSISGPYNSGNALDLVLLTLPNTKIVVDIPLLHYSLAIPDNLYAIKKGITPDVFIHQNIKDLINKKDLILDSTITLINAKKYR